MQLTKLVQKLSKINPISHGVQVDEELSEFVLAFMTVMLLMGMGFFVQEIVFSRKEIGVNHCMEN